MIAVFIDPHEVIVVGLNADGSPMDADGTLFGPKSGRDIHMFARINANYDKGQTVHVDFVSSARVEG